MRRRRQSRRPARESSEAASASRRAGGAVQLPTLARRLLVVSVAACTLMIVLQPPANAQQGYDSSHYRAEREVPDYHVVEDGDTMYALASQYYGDPYRWPKLWSFNSHVTNPHWIYPGDIVYLKPEVEQASATDNATSEPATTTQSDETQRDGRTKMRLPIGGFTTEQRPDYVGTIVASPKEARLLAQFDRAWVGFGDKARVPDGYHHLDEEIYEDVNDPGDVQIGDKFSIVREAGKVKDFDGNVIGYKYETLGALEVTETSERNLETAEIVQSWAEIERGDMLVPYERQLRTVTATPSDQDLVARIIDTVQPRFDLAESHYVYIDKGAREGVRVGNRFFVYQKTEGLLVGPDDPNDPDEMPSDIPWRRVGQILVIDTGEGFSTGLVTNSTRELSEGDRLEMYKNY